MYVLYCVTKTGKRHILHIADNIKEAKAIYNCIDFNNPHTNMAYIGYTEKSIDILENDPFFDEKSYFHDLKID